MNQKGKISEQKGGNLSERYSLAGQLVESCAVSHCRRFYPTYYIKAKGEVDIACVQGKQFWPIEVKWTSQLRPGELKQIRKYSNGQIMTKSSNSSEILGLTATQLPIALYLVDRLFPAAQLKG